MGCGPGRDGVTMRPMPRPESGAPHDFARPVPSSPRGASARPAIVSPEHQNVTFVELFFDLVFVFAVTKTVGLLHHGSLGALGQAVVVFWLVWWAWTQFTWALNAADTTHTLVEIVTLLATGVTFFMALALPQAFGARGLWFGLAYVLVRGTGLLLYAWVAWSDVGQRAAVIRFATASLLGLGAVLAGAVLGPPAQYALWAVAIALDVVAALVGARAEGWNLHAEHFGERHGLFVIIALGETLIVAASGVTAAEWTPQTLGIAALAVCLASAMWWTYFPRAKPALECEMATRTGAAQSTLARDVYSLAHFPIVCGIIAFAVALENALAHASEPVTTGSAVALAAGVLLFLGGMGVALWRAMGRPPRTRLVVSLVTAAAVVAVAGGSVHLALGVACVGVLVVAVVEQITMEREEPDWAAEAALGHGAPDPRTEVPASGTAAGRAEGASDLPEG